MKLNILNIFLVTLINSCIAFGPRHYSYETQERIAHALSDRSTEKDVFINALVKDMTSEELSTSLECL